MVENFDHFFVAERTGLEPATPCVTGRYSNQLNYRSNIHFLQMGLQKYKFFLKKTNFFCNFV